MGGLDQEHSRVVRGLLFESIDQGLLSFKSSEGVGKTCHWGGAKLYHLGVIGQHKCPNQLFGRRVPETGWQQAGRVNEDGFWCDLWVVQVVQSLTRGVIPAVL